jgi:subtilase family serine protease
LAFVIDSDPSQPDLNLYLGYFQVNRTGRFYDRIVDGGGSGFPGNDSLEADLDYETEASLAPGADVYEYSIPDLSWQSMFDGMNAVIQDDKVDAASLSFGGCENNAPSSTLGAMNQILHQADLEGITFGAATGDEGLFYCAIGPGQYVNTGIEAPASTPDITAVGGTAAGAMGSNAPYTNQSGWGCGAAGCNGSGGGYSDIWATPPYQSPIPYLVSRSVPDISLAADDGNDVAGDNAFIVYEGNYILTGGTSWASPIFAAFQTTWNQETGTRRGFANVAMYDAYESSSYTQDCLTDVTTGNNGSQAAVGWDYVTGLGSIYWGCSF